MAVSPPGPLGSSQTQCASGPPNVHHRGLWQEHCQAAGEACLGAAVLMWVHLSPTYATRQGTENQVQLVAGKAVPGAACQKPGSLEARFCHCQNHENPKAGLGQRQGPKQPGRVPLPQPPRPWARARGPGGSQAEQLLTSNEEAPRVPCSCSLTGLWVQGRPHPFSQEWEGCL